MKKIILSILAIVLVAMIALAIYLLPTFRNMFSYEKIDHDLQLTIMTGYGGNSILLTSNDGDSALIVDTKMAGGSKKVRKLVEQLAPDAVLTIVNTHFHFDHSAGNSRFPKATIVAGAYSEEDWKEASGMERAPDLMLEEGDTLIMRYGDEVVQVRNMGRGHTWNDVVVYLENRNMLITGDLLFNGWHPPLLGDDGASVSGWTSILNRLIDDYDPDVVVPGHGPLCNESALVTLRDYFVSAESAIGNDMLREELEDRYSGWFRIPMTSSLDKTMAFITKEHATQ
ncbi:MAG: MBL fold metallo-hydrolase [candidate division KSB1 bacterium]|jgi:glyoxylase-like metal-dependent hydrolase (beta-lactamase superfamily II)|nr:MBL fold metallo-hydrolase [candidate division KSB1 bacterium]